MLEVAMPKGMWLGFRKTGPCSGADIQRQLQLKEVTVRNHNAKADMLLLMSCTLNFRFYMWLVC